MTPAYRIQNGDCCIELKLLAECSVDSIVCDPPYELSFMSKKWDSTGIAYNVEVWRECLRVLKPGGHLLAFGGSRTFHRLACAIEDAGFEIRDTITWLFGQGFPKSLNLGCRCNERPNQMAGTTVRDLQQGIYEAQDLDETDNGAFLQLPMQRSATRAGVEEVGRDRRADFKSTGEPNTKGKPGREESRVEGRRDFLAKEGKLQADQIRPLPAGISGNGAKGRIRDGTPPSDSAKVGQTTNENRGGASHQSQPTGQPNREPNTVSHQSSAQALRGPGAQCSTCGGLTEYQGFGTALKPAAEYITLARKPLSEKTVAQNVLQHGTGGLNIDGCRVDTVDRVQSSASKGAPFGEGAYELGEGRRYGEQLGRWPANVILSYPEDEFVLRSDVTPKQRKELLKWMYANA